MFSQHNLHYIYWAVRKTIPHFVLAPQTLVRPESLLLTLPYLLPQVEEGPDLCGDPGEPNIPISLEQLMAQLCEQALTGAISCSTCVSTQELSGEADDICSIVIGHVWEATGFRFMYGWFPLEGQWLMLPLYRKKYTQKNGTV